MLVLMKSALLPWEQDSHSVLCSTTLKGGRPSCSTILWSHKEEPQVPNHKAGYLDFKKTLFLLDKKICKAKGDPVTNQ